MHNDKTFVIVEHHFIYALEQSAPIKNEEGHWGVPPKVFQEIEQFVLQNGSETSRFLIPSYHKGYGKTLKAQQFVGVIETRSGYVIEILPKIAKSSKIDEDKKLNDEESARKIFLKMLRTLKDSPFKHFDQAALKSTKMHLLEIYISMFCEEMATLVRRGLKSDYVSRTENANALKGRLKMSEHLRQNLVHKERFFVEFDEYEVSRIENRILRTTLEFLLKKSRSDRNQKRLREFLFVFDEISPVFDIKSSFSQIKMGRQMKDYENLLRWARMFLDSESFSSFKGKSVAFALLFDMNKVFEDYVAHCLRRDNTEWIVETQIREKYLLFDPKEFLLKPDLRVTESANEEWIGDTKWKLLNPSDRHYGISQSDLYQMYAYGHKYEIKKIKLIYPWFEGFPKIPKYKFESDFDLEIWAFDCETGKLSYFDPAQKESKSPSP
jgi:5-methylcytosine-specific restriction enzyme subunit McrC